MRLRRWSCRVVCSGLVDDGRSWWWCFGSRLDPSRSRGALQAACEWQRTCKWWRTCRWLRTASPGLGRDEFQSLINKSCRASTLTVATDASVPLRYILNLDRALVDPHMLTGGPTCRSQELDQVPDGTLSPSSETYVIDSLFRPIQR